MSALVKATKTDCRITGVCGRQGRTCPNAGFVCRILLRTQDVSPAKGTVRMCGLK